MQDFRQQCTQATQYNEDVNSIRVIVVKRYASPMLLSDAMTNMFQATTCPKTSSRKASSVPSEQRSPRRLSNLRTAPRSETPAKQIWTYVYNHDVDKRRTCWSGCHEQFCCIFPSSFTLPFCLATDIDITDRRTVMHKSADQPTARMLPMVASLDHVRQYSTIIIRIAIRKVRALRHTSG